MAEFGKKLIIPSRVGGSCEFMPRVNTDNKKGIMHRRYSINMYSLNKCSQRDTLPDKAIQTKIAEGEHRYKTSTLPPPAKLKEVSLCVHVYEGFSFFSEQ